MGRVIESTWKAASRSVRFAAIPAAASCALFLLANAAAFGSGADRTPSTRTWEEVTSDFLASRGDDLLAGQRDGALLRKIDPECALSFLLDLVGKDQPKELRLKTLYALDAAALPASAPAIEKIALDPQEDPRVRYSALWPTLSKFDKNRAAEIGIVCLHDSAREVRLGAYQLLGATGGKAAIAALQQQFLTTDEKQLAFEALGHTHDPAAIEFLVKHSPLEQLRMDENWRTNFVRAMAATPVADAQSIMTALMKESNSYLQTMALPYFRRFPCAEIGPDVAAHFQDKKFSQKVLKSYPDLWFFANVPSFPAESKRSLRELVKAVYPDAAFERPVTEPDAIDEETLGAVIGATFSDRPAGFDPGTKRISLVMSNGCPSDVVVALAQRPGYWVEPASEYQIHYDICAVHSVQRVADGQILLRETFSDSEWGFLVVRKGENWVEVKREQLRIICW